MKRKVAYYRVSTERQGQSGLGIDVQREAVSRYLNGETLLAEFVEVESGKRHKNRPKLLAALELCRKQRATLVIAKLDRLARNVHFISGLLESGVEFVCCDNPQANKPMLHMIAVFAEWERELISQRTREAMQRIKLHLQDYGERTSIKGRVYTKLGNPRIEEARQIALELKRQLRPAPQILNMIKRAHTDGRSLRSIADQLNASNIRTPGGHRWYASTVRTVLLKNERTREPNDAMTNARYDDVVHERNDARAQARNDASASTSLLPVIAIPATPQIFASTGREAKTRGAPMPSNVVEALSMLDLFTSVGAREFVLTRYDIEKNVKWGKHYFPAGLRETLPTTMRLAAIRYRYTLKDGRTVETGDNLAIRPTGPGVSLFQLDDLTQDYLNRVRLAAFLMHETSPGNYQAWIAVSGLPDDKEGTKASCAGFAKLWEGTINPPPGRQN